MIIVLLVVNTRQRCSLTLAGLQMRPMRMCRITCLGVGGQKRPYFCNPRPNLQWWIQGVRWVRTDMGVVAENARTGCIRVVH